LRGRSLKRKGWGGEGKALMAEREDMVRRELQ
jgi:hypothetical protein